MSRSNIGEFEEIVMLTIGILGESAYGLAIKLEIENRLKRVLAWARCIQVCIGWRKKVI
jgi:hypothetical protein